MTELWPPDYHAVSDKRVARLARLRETPSLWNAAKAFYATQPIEFIQDWCCTIDPRNAGSDIPAKMPFILFERQRELVEFIVGCIDDQECGLVEKCRTAGATWVCCAVSVWIWLFRPGSSVGWGSRKEQLVDRSGDMDSIFEKMRAIVANLPQELRPIGFRSGHHMSHMRLINPENGASITGEAGDNIGRGGRKLIYFKDEAQPLGAKILTPLGWSTMGDMRVGSEVIGPDGATRKVIGINDAGVHDVYKVTFSDGTSTRCSPNHLWSVETVIGKPSRSILKTTEILDLFRYQSPKGQVQYRFRIPVTSAVAFPVDPVPLPLDAYLVGALIGDGTLGAVPNHSPKITTIDPEIIEQFRKLLPKGCTIKQEPGRPTWRLGDELGRQGPGRKSRARQAVLEAGIAGCGAKDKFIPPRYLRASVTDRIAILQGLLDTDGSAANNYGGSVSFHTSSTQLAEDVRFIVQSLGGTATMNVKQDKRGYLPQIVLHIVLPDGIVPFRLARKIEALTGRKHPMGRTIVGVELVGREPVRCITVDAPDGLYLTDHMIVTHNSAHYERPEKIEAALSENTRVQIDISSVNGLGNVFHRRRQGGVDWAPGRDIPKGKTRVFVFDWRDHPAMTEEWYRQRKQKWLDDGLPHIFAQEVDRNYAASVQGVIINAEWVESAIDAHMKLAGQIDGLDSGGWAAALDVADGGNDANAIGARKGVVLKKLEKWGGVDTGVTTRKAVVFCDDLGAERVDLFYDCIGVGAGVKAETNRLQADRDDDGRPLMPKCIQLAPWNAGAGPIDPRTGKPVESKTVRLIANDPNTPYIEDFYGNLKAQGWWELARRFERTHRAIHEGIKYSADELISLDSSLPYLRELQAELSQPTASRSTGRLKLIVDKAPEGTRSPNLADCVMMAYWPVEIVRTMQVTADVLRAHAMAFGARY